LFALVSIVALATAYVGFVNYRFRAAHFDHQLPSTPMVWAHAAYRSPSHSNPLPLIEQTFQDGAKGVEIDIHFDAPSQRFVISHDEPYARFEGELRYLDEVFSRCKRSGYYWLDFKNLAWGNYHEARSRLLELLQLHNLTDRVYVESRNGLLLRTFASHGIKTIYWIGYDDLWPGPLKALRSKGVIAISQFNAVSSPFARVEKPSYMEEFSHLPLFAFTINDPARLERFRRLGPVAVVLSDRLYVAGEAPSQGTR